jgi:hypothetical protein
MEHSTKRWILYTCLLLVFATLLAEGHNKKSIQRSYDYGYALQFDGSADFVSLPELNFGSPFSLEFLARPRGNGGTAFEFSDSNGRNMVRISVNSDGKLNFLVVNDKGTSSSVTSDDNLDNNRWNYVIITVTSSGVVTFYIERDNSDEDSSSKTLTKGYAPWAGLRSVNYIGKSRTTGSSNGAKAFNGDLDEIRLWSRLLTSDEIDGGRLRPLRGDEDNLLVFYDCNQGTGLALADIGLNQFHGSLGANDVSKSPNWIVSGFAPSSTCTVSGNYVKTFDKKTFTISNNGYFWMTNTTKTADSVPDILAQVRVNARRKASCLTLTPDGFAFQTAKDYVIFDFDLTTKSDTIVSWNQQTVTVPNFVGSTGISIVKTITNSKTNAHTIEFQVPFTFSGKITVDPKSGDTQIDIKLTETPYKNNNINGLCGDFDGNYSDDTGATISATWPVVGPSLFTGSYDLGDPITQIECNVQDYPLLYNASKPICENTTWVSTGLKDRCYYDVCVAGDISGAVKSAQETYSDCLENSSNTGGGNLCNKPCPNFCSFNGQCINGQCTCKLPWIGKDCSQKSSYPCFAASWQGEPEVILQPFTGTATLTNHYQYNTPRYSSANTNNEIQDTSVVYIYQQLGSTASNSTASLVVINDLPLDGSGGKANLQVTFTNAVGGPLGGVSLTVRDDSNDKYNTTALSSSGRVSANWAWSECCTDGFALSNLPLTSDFCAALTFSGLQGISQGVVASRDLNGDQEVTSFPLTQTVQICGKNCTNSCVQHTSCDTCMADSNCGWCSDSEVCVPGSSEGPDSGKCRSWRYSFTASRVLSQEPGYPVDPSTLEYFLNSTQAGPFQVSFSVRVPPNEDVPLEALILQDISSAFASDLSLLRASVVQTYLRILDTYPSTKLAVGAFSDKPLSPYGSPTYPDYTYTIRSSLSDDPSAIQAALNSLTVAYGGDEPNSQLEALLLAAKRTEVGWSSSARKVIILITKSSFHTPVQNSNLVPNNGDGDFPNNGASENYPTVDQVKSALLGANIIPLFITTSTLAPLYQSLVSQLGFGYVSSFTELNAQSIFSEALQALDDLGGLIQPVIYQQGDIVSSITPTKYTGISSRTRVTFQVSLSNISNDDAIIVVPGFGSITLSHLVTDNPVADSNDDLVVLTGDDVTLRLSGTTVYDGVLQTLITQLPHGAVFQYNGSSRGAQLTGQGPWVVSDPSGRVIYNANGISSVSMIKYYLKDSCQACSTFASFQISTALSKSLPVASSNSGSCAEDTSVSINLNGTSADPSSLVARITSLPSGGRLFSGANQITTFPIDIPSGVVTYYPNANQYGLESAGFLYDSFYFTVYDSQGQSIQDALVSLYVTPTPDAPVASNVAASGYEDQAVSFTFDASDADGDTLSYTIVSMTAGSYCIGNAQSCSWSSTVPFNTTSQTLNFKAPTNANGQFQITYTANDNIGPSNIATVTITIAPVNDLPVPSPGADSTNEDTSKQFILAITDIDNPASQVGPVICSWNGPGILVDSTGAAISYTSTFYNLPLGSNLVTFTPAANANGASYATISFAGRDLDGTSGCVNFVISVTAVNDAPQSFSDTVTVVESTQTVITLRGYDVDTPTLTFYLCSAPVQGSIVNADNSAINTVITGVSGQTATLKYTPVAFQNGQNYATIGFKTFDGQYNSSCSSITINVAGVQNAPSTTGTSPSPVITNEDTPIVVTINCSDPDGDTLTFKIEDPLPAASNIILAEVATGSNITTSRLISGNQIRILPYLNWNGNTAFTYSCTDGNNTAVPSTVSVTINPVNDLPTAFGQTITTNENQDQVILLTGSDIETATLTYRIINTVTRGTLSVCVDQACTSVSGTASDGSQVISGAVQFHPTPYTNDGNTGVYTSFSFIAVDGASANSTPAIVTIGVTPVNYPPQATTPNTTVTAPYNQDIVLYLSASDPDDDPVNVTVSAVGLVGKLYQYDNTTSGRGPQIQGSNVPVSDIERRVIYTTQTGAKSSSSVDIISYTVSDPAGLSGSGQVNVTLPLNNPPVANATAQYTILEDTSVTITLSGVDYDDLNNVFTAYISALPTKGSLFQADGVTPINTTGTVVTDSSNRVIFRPTLNENGNAYSNFSYYVVSQNTTQPSLPAVLTISVTPVNDLPIFTTTGVVVPERNYTQFNVSCYDPDGDKVTVMWRYANGGYATFFQVNSDGTQGPPIAPNAAGDTNITNPNYMLGVIPRSGFSGSIEIYVRLCDWSGCTTFIAVPFYVFAYPEPPVAYGYTYTMAQPQVGATTFFMNYDLVFNDPDESTGQQHAYNLTIVTLPNRGTLHYFCPGTASNIITLNGNRSIDLPPPSLTHTICYTPDSYSDYGPNFANFTFMITDDTGLTSNVATFRIVATAPCSVPAVIIPTAPNNVVNTTAGQSVTYYWTIQDDAPMDDIFIIRTQPAHGRLATRYDMQVGPQDIYPYVNLTADAGNAVDLVLYSYSGDGVGWYIDYIPNPGYSGPDCFQYMYYTCSSDPQNMILWPDVFTGCVYVQDVNTAPSITVTSNYSVTSTNPITIMGVSVSDDSLTFPIIVTLQGVGASSISLVSTTGISYVQNNATTITITSPVSAISSALAQGITFTPITSGSLIISVNDQGYYSEAAAGQGSPLTARKSVTITINTSQSLNTTPAGVTAAFVGGTSIVSAAVYGVYRTLKSKKLIPEEADPWENDDAFDATNDNPLYAAGETPIYSSAM